MWPLFLGARIFFSKNCSYQPNIIILLKRIPSQHTYVLIQYLSNSLNFFSDILKQNTKTVPQLN